MKKRNFTSRHTPAGNPKASQQEKKRDVSPSFLRTPLLPVLIIVVVAFAVYCRALSNGFVYDDDAQVVENLWIRDIGFLPKLFLTDVWKFYGEGVSNYYRPVMHTVYMINYHIFGLAAWGFHLVNILVHAGVSVLVFFITSRLLNESGSSLAAPYSPTTGVERIFSPALMAALVFAVHPVNTEAVTWVAGLPELSFTFFYLLSLYLYMDKPDGSRPSVTTLLVSAASFFLATLSKETALTLPLVLFAYDAVFQRDRARFTDRLKGYIPYLAVVILYFGMRLNALETFAPVRRHKELSVYQYVINVFPFFSQYLEKLVLPVNLSAYYVFHPLSTIFTAQGVFSFFVTIAFISIAVLAARKNRVACFCLVLIAVPLLPVLYIPALGENSFTERYLYLPSAGLSILIGLGVMKAAEKPSRRRAVVLAFSLLLGLFSLGTVLRIPVWKDNFSLWTDTLPKASDGAIPHSLMGDAFLSRGQNDLAVEQYKIAIKLKPDYADAHTNMGAAYKNLGLMDQAVRELQTAVELKPSSAIAHSSLGVLYNETGFPGKAIDELQTALKINPFLPGTYIGLGDVYSSKDMMDEAIRQYQEGIRIDPDFAEARNNLGIAYARTGNFPEALEQFQAAVRLKPGDPAYYYNTAKAFKALGMSERSEEFLRRARQMEAGKP